MLSKILPFVVHLFRQNSRSCSVFLGYVSKYFISTAFIYNLKSHLLTGVLFLKFSVPRELQPWSRLKKINRRDKRWHNIFFGSPFAFAGSFLCLYVICLSGFLAQAWKWLYHINLEVLWHFTHQCWLPWCLWSDVCILLICSFS